MSGYLEFPAVLLREQTSAWQIKASTVSPGQNIFGSFPRMRTDGGGLWSAEYGSINLRTADHIRAWRAIETMCDGGAAPIIVPMCDKRQMPTPITAGSRLYTYGKIPHSDASLFSDGSGYHQPVVRATIGAAAPLRGTVVNIVFAQGGPLRGGERFSIEHPIQGWRLYQVGKLDAAGNATIRPPLREALVGGEAVEFDRPRCVMMLADPSGMKLSMSLRRFANPDVNFIEYPSFSGG